MLSVDVTTNDPDTKGPGHKCGECGAVYTAKNNLLRHIRYKHEGVKFLCVQCNYCTKDACGLKHHVKIKHEVKKAKREKHRKDVIFVCNNCEYSTSIKTELGKHKQYEHDIFE